MVKINPQKIVGKWRKGYALDVHTVSSTYLGPNEYGHEQWDNVRSEMGELLYRLKYNGDESAVQPIVETVRDVLAKNRKFDVIVPVPSSRKRSLPPVKTIADGIGHALGVAVAECVTPVREATELKDVTDPEQRKALLNGLYTIDPAHTRGKRVLMFDDLFRSGATMNAVAELLYGAGGAADVCALTLTCTRSKR